MNQNPIFDRRYPRPHLRYACRPAVPSGAPRAEAEVINGVAAVTKSGAVAHLNNGIENRINLLV